MKKKMYNVRRKLKTMPENKTKPKNHDILSFLAFLSSATPIPTVTLPSLSVLLVLENFLIGQGVCGILDYIFMVLAWNHQMQEDPLHSALNRISIPSKGGGN